MQACAARGVQLKWFGEPQPVGFTSTYTSWTYARPRPMPRSDRVLAAILDMRLPLTFSIADCGVLAARPTFRPSALRALL